VVVALVLKELCDLNFLGFITLKIKLYSSLRAEICAVVPAIIVYRKAFDSVAWFQVFCPDWYLS